MPGVVYTIEEEKFIEDNFYIMVPEEIAEKLKRSVDAIECKAKYLGLKRRTEENVIGEYVKKRISENAEEREIKEGVKALFNKEITTKCINYYRRTKERNIGMYVTKTTEDETKAIIYTQKIEHLKRHIKVGDVIKFNHEYGVMECEVVGKYRNFINVLVNGRKESVLYCDVLSIEGKTN